MESVTAQRMLLVDDDPVVLSTLSRGLERLGVDVDAYDNTSEALLHLEADRYIAVIADQVLPGALCGHEFLLAAQQVDPQALTILMSEMDGMDAHPAAERFDATVGKPVAPADLVERIRMIQTLRMSAAAAA
mgnify:CR=1 FL=1